MLWWKKYNCWYWNYYLGITECDHLLNPIGEEFSGWLHKLKNDDVLQNLHILSDLNSLGIILQEGKYYKLKLGTVPLNP